LVARISKHEGHMHGLGAEHPKCDKMQLAMMVLFFAVWILDSFSSFVSNYSTVISFIPLVARLFLAIVSLGLALFLTTKSHGAVFVKKGSKPRLIDAGVYSWVRHPMYLGTLLFCLGFFFAIPSLLSLIVWIAFFILYDRMATYEEKDLIQKLGEDYIAYKRRVPKWFPKLSHRN
jgi:protein-S-isoprenylcysteine O-methyltransferase Ste14